MSIRRGSVHDQRVGRRLLSKRVVTAAWCMFAGLVFLFSAYALISRSMHPYPGLVDFVQEWTSARNYLSGHPIYMDLNASVALNLGNGRAGLPEGSFNVHPPVAVMLALPFGLLGYQSGLVAWTMVSLAALALSLVLIVRQPGLGYGWLSLSPIVTIVLLSNPFSQQVHHGQLNLFLLLLITGGWVAARAGRRELGAIQIALAAALKLFPAFLFLYFLARREWRSLFVGGLAFVFVSIIAIAVLGVGNVLTYVADVLPTTGRFSDLWLNASLGGYWSKLFHTPSGHVMPLLSSPTIAYGLTLASSGVVIAAVSQRVRVAESMADHDRAFALAVIGMLLVSPITWDHNLLLLIPSLALIWKTTPATAFNRTFLIGVIALLAINPGVVWRALIAGDGEWARGAARSVARPVHTLTILSYPLYTLLALFGFAFFTKTTTLSATDAESPPPLLPSARNPDAVLKTSPVDVSASSRATLRSRSKR